MLLFKYMKIQFFNSSVTTTYFLCWLTIIWGFQFSRCQKHSKTILVVSWCYFQIRASRQHFFKLLRLYKICTHISFIDATNQNPLIVYKMQHPTKCLGSDKSDYVKKNITLTNLLLYQFNYFSIPQLFSCMDLHLDLI